MSILGVDVGGTFTDFYYFADGRLQVHKRPSTPSNPGDSILAGISERGWRPDSVVHGSTVATNTVLERRGARVAFITTRGFRDLLEIGRQARPRVYELEPRRPPAIAPRDLCFEAAERIDYEGNALLSLEEAEIERVVREVVATKPDAVAVCLLFACLNPDHEQRLGKALREAGLDVSLSSEVLPEIREYERASTTVLNAYVGPRMRTYLGELDSRLREAGCDSLSIVQSSGGTLTASQASSLAAATLLSGPAAGVAGAFAVASHAGFDHIVSFDMGGTSTDLCLCPGRIPFTSEWSIAGLPVRLPAVDVHTVGAGGGSIAWLDEGGALRVGPQSAGATPGPAAYRHGGPATTTDAQLVLGRLDQSSFLGGSFEVDRAASKAALAALSIGSAETAARGVITVANAVMEKALRVVSVERGYDPADFTLVAFGGAGPLHACELADAVRIRRVLIPRHPGVLSAMGMLWADAMRDYSAPLPGSLSASTDLKAFATRLESHLTTLQQRALDEMGPAALLEPALDLRYQGQGYELTVPWTPDKVLPLPAGEGWGEGITEPSTATNPSAHANNLSASEASPLPRKREGQGKSTPTPSTATHSLSLANKLSTADAPPLPEGTGGCAVRSLIDAFHAEHQRRYGHADPSRTLESVTLRLRARIPAQRVEEPPIAPGTADASAAVVGRRSLVLEQKVEAPVYDRERLLAGNFIAGPAIVSQMDSTTLISEGWQATVDEQGNLILEKA